jgi:hypothetical protein
MILKFGFLLVNKKNKAECFNNTLILPPRFKPFYFAKAMCEKILLKTEWEWFLSQKERRGKFPHPA